MKISLDSYCASIKRTIVVILCDCLRAHRATSSDTSAGKSGISNENHCLNMEAKVKEDRDLEEFQFINKTDAEEGRCPPGVRSNWYV